MRGRKRLEERPDPALIASASVLIGGDFDLNALPDSALKSEFLELADLALKDRIRSLQKARLEVLCGKLEEMWEKHKERRENEGRLAESEEVREKKDRYRRLLRHKTRKGQPNLRNLAKVQLAQIKELMEKEMQGET
jgi:hypothetical protein